MAVAAQTGEIGEFIRATHRERDDVVGIEHPVIPPAILARIACATVDLPPQRIPIGRIAGAYLMSSINPPVPNRHANDERHDCGKDKIRTHALPCSVIPRDVMTAHPSDLSCSPIGEELSKGTRDTRRRWQTGLSLTAFIVCITRESILRSHKATTSDTRSTCFPIGNPIRNMRLSLTATISSPNFRPQASLSIVTPLLTSSGFASISARVYAKSSAVTVTGPQRWASVRDPCRGATRARQHRTDRPRAAGRRA